SRAHELWAWVHIRYRKRPLLRIPLARSLSAGPETRGERARSPHCTRPPPCTREIELRAQTLSEYALARGHRFPCVSGIAQDERRERERIPLHLRGVERAEVCGTIVVANGHPGQAASQQRDVHQQTRQA